MGAAPRRRADIRPLVVSRIVDQAALGLGSLLLARVLGTDGFAPAAVLFVVNSLAIQVSDFGLGFAILRLDPGVVVDRGVLRRLRSVGVAMALLAGVLGLAIGSRPGLLILASGVIWFASSEAYVRKAAALKLGHARRVAVAEVSGATVFLVGVVVVAATGGGAAWVGLLLVLKHLTEIALVRGWQPLFAHDGGHRPRSGPEWLSQIATYLVANVDYAIVAIVLGPSDLSIYVIAFRIAAAAPALLSGPITQTAFLDLSSAESDRQATYEHLVARAAKLGAVGTVLVLVAAPILPWVLGSPWQPVRALLVVLALAVPWRLLLGLTVAEGLTAGAGHRVVRWEAVRFAVIGGLVLVGVQGGLEWAGVAVTVGTVASIAWEHRRASAVAGLVPDRRFLPASAAVVVAAVALGALLT